MFTLRQASVKMAVLLHKKAKVPFVLSLAVDLDILAKFHNDMGKNYVPFSEKFICK